MKCFKIEYNIMKATLTAFVYMETEEGAKQLSEHHSYIIDNKETQVNVLALEFLTLEEVK